MRCIAHLDMDCFYAQVEAVRLGIDCRTVPLVLSQWDCPIAVNYPARSYGIKRGQHSTTEAKELCPDLVVALSPSYKKGEFVSKYHPNPIRDQYKISLEPYRLASRKFFAILASEHGVQVEKGGVDEAYLDVTEAAQLELDQLRATTAASTGADLDLLDPLTAVLEPSTHLIADRRAEMAAWFAERGTSLAEIFDAPMAALLRGERGRGVDGSRGFCVSADDACYAERCRLLCAASRVVARLRRRLYAELHYDCSAGIAHNRVLAKCISATHKPNQQTLLLPDRSASALFDLPLRRLRGFGGKFGAAVSALCGGATDCRELWLVPLSQLSALSRFSYGAGDDDNDDNENDGDDGIEARAGSRRQARKTDNGEAEVTSANSHKKSDTASKGDATGGSDAGTAEYVFYRIRGVNGDQVADPALPRSMEASKIFHPSCMSWSAARLWMAPLAGELWHRFRHYESRYNNEGRSLVVYFRTYVSPDDARFGGMRSQSYRRHTALPTVITGAAMLAEMGLRELEKLMRDVTAVDIEPLKIEFRPCGPPFIETGDASSHTVAAPGADGEATSEEDVERKLIDREVDVRVPMPPLRIIGLSIIGLRVRAVQETGKEPSSAAPDLPQRSLKAMFAHLSAKEKTQPQAGKCGRSSHTDASLPVVEVDSDDGSDGDDHHRGNKEQQRAVRGRPSIDRVKKSRLESSTSPSPPHPAPTPPPPRRTLEDFLLRPSSATLSREKVRLTEVRPAVEKKTKKKTRTVDGTYQTLHHQLRSSASVIEVSSGDDSDDEATR